MARAPRGSPSDIDKLAAPPNEALALGSVTRSVLKPALRPTPMPASMPAPGLRPLSNDTSWLTSVRLTDERNGTPSAEKKSIVSLYWLTRPLKL